MKNVALVVACSMAFLVGCGGEAPESSDTQEQIDQSENAVDGCTVTTDVEADDVTTPSAGCQGEPGTDSWHEETTVTTKTCPGGVVIETGVSIGTNFMFVPDDPSLPSYLGSFTGNAKSVEPGEGKNILFNDTVTLNLTLSTTGQSFRVFDFTTALFTPDFTPIQEHETTHCTTPK